MRILIIFFALLSLVSCGGNGESTTKKSDLNEAGKSNKKNKQKTDTLNVIRVATDYPKDTIYPANILTSGGVFHQDEVDPKSPTYRWKGIFKSDTGYYVSDTKIKLSKDYDAVMDDEGQKTGWTVATNIKDSCILLISGTDYLQNRQIQKIKLGKEQILPGENYQFVYNSVTYTLYATGNKKRESPKSDAFVVSNYKLFLKASVNGQSYNQLLVSISNFDDAMTTLLFVGDIDGDNIPDMIIDTTNHYDAEVPTLYLSKRAKSGTLLKVMGKHTTVGC